MLKFPQDRTIPLMIWLVILSGLSIWSMEKLPVKHADQAQKLRLCDAKLEDLMAIPRMQVRIAREILKLRDNAKDWDDFKSIRGVGPKALTHLQARYVVAFEQQ